ncbi:hypothetical protein K490DRAFT_56503 [Saccharata proteae CBS 121410]|uniref:Uncharacterized protein n=1 Tax=Saccharata proteae CBS 121410 TaxID=1314787 RepID=A0A9P4LX98_9PEZI|nr:hypothetical protein K490DRAFT_56503 [Saccharata proteae CBS 121410]
MTSTAQPASNRQSRSSCGGTSTAAQSKRSSRIEKPRSIHNSPSALERRKTTSAVKRYATLEDHWNMMFGSGDSDDGQDNLTGSTTSARPVSWHPASSHYPDSYLSSPADDLPFQNGNYAFPDHASAYQTLTSGYISYPTSSYGPESFYQTQDYPTSALTSNRTSMETSPFPAWNDPLSPMADTTLVTPSFPSRNMASRTWAAGPPTSQPRIQSASSDFLPIQHPEGAFDDESMDTIEPSEKEPGKILVGMGLYDPPNYESLLTTGLGKGLKLEETFQPPEPEEDDDDAEESSSDDDDDDDSVDEAPAPPEQSNWSLHSAQQAQTPATDFSSQSFLLEDEETYANEWWYQQLKRPTAQDAGIGYGWL